MENFIECAVSNLATSSENFIYRIIPNGGSASEELQRDFVSISSDDSLTFFKVRDRSIIVDDRIEGVNKGVTCLEPLDEIRNIFATAGRDGVINLCNGVERALKRAFRTPNHEAISAIAPSQKAVCLVAGTESQSNGPGQVSIYVWDLESSAKAPLHKFEEWHTDSITTLSFLPQNMHVLLSGSTDGLVTMFDLRETGEEAEPVEIFNTGSAVNLASPVCEQDSTTGQPRVFGIFVASHNEDLSFQATTQESRQRHEGMNIKPWNFRADLGTDYAISLRHSARRENHILLAVGANKVETTASPRIDVCYVTLDPNSEKFNCNVLARLQGGHGTEVVRDIWFAETMPYVLTCGEDGMIRMWHSNGSCSMSKLRDTPSVSEDMKPSKRRKV